MLAALTLARLASKYDPRLDATGEPHGILTRPG